MNYQQLNPKTALSVFSIALAVFSTFSNGHYSNAQTTDTVTKQVDSTYLGLQVRELPKALQRHLPRLRQGVLIELVAEGSNADKMGMKAGDILCQINGVDVVSVRDFAQIQKLENVRLMRGGRYFMIVNRTMFADDPPAHAYAADVYTTGPKTIARGIGAPSNVKGARKPNWFHQRFRYRMSPNFTQQQRKALQASKYLFPNFNPPASTHPAGTASIAVASSSSSMSRTDEAIAMSNTNGQWEIEIQIPGLLKKLHLRGTRDEVLAQVQSMAATQDVREAVRKRLLAAGL